MRPNATLKLGYFPLPTEEAERIRRSLAFPGSPFAALDPCIGDGSAFGKIAGDEHALRYGIELDAYRAEQARAVAHQVVLFGVRRARRECDRLQDCDVSRARKRIHDIRRAWGGLANAPGRPSAVYSIPHGGPVCRWTRSRTCWPNHRPTDRLVEFYFRLRKASRAAR